MNISPIFYMGNKRKLIKKGLVDLFPDDIKTFVDLFAGSGVVSMNVEAENYIINDKDKNLQDMYKMFYNHSEEKIIVEVEKNIEIFGFARISTDKRRCKDAELIAKHKEAYANLRDYYNHKLHNSSVFDFYTLMFFSFSQQFRFGKDGKFNMPCGHDYFSQNCKNRIVNGTNFFAKDVKTLNKEFDQIEFAKDMFVYLDPPYINTTAVYNENGGWTEEHEDRLYSLMEHLTAKDIKFALSNTYHNKGIENTRLIKFVADRDLNAYTFDKHSYSACGKGNSETTEVLITNYIKGAKR